MNETELTNHIDRYCTCWRVMGMQEREESLGIVLTRDVRYVDPGTDVTGINQLALHIERVANARPQAQAVRTSSVDVHHDVARFGWHLVDRGEELLVGSIDVVTFVPATGLINMIVGFFGPTKPATSPSAATRVLLAARQQFEAKSFT